mgnify:CR=1 FL=1
MHWNLGGSDGLEAKVGLLTSLEADALVLSGGSAFGLAACDGVVAIPMHGAKESLNVAVSFGIMAYAARRHWEERARP